MAGRRRMRVRQPDVHGGNAGLGAKTGDGQNGAARRRPCPHRQEPGARAAGFREVIPVASPEADKKRPAEKQRPGARQPGMSRKHRAPCCPRSLKSIRKKRRKGHDFPGQQEQYGIGRAGDVKGHPGQQEKIKTSAPRYCARLPFFVPERD